MKRKTEASTGRELSFENRNPDADRVLLTGRSHRGNASASSQQIRRSPSAMSTSRNGMAVLSRFRRQSPATGSMLWGSATKGGDLGKAEKYSINGYPFQKFLHEFQTRDFTPATLGWHIRSKNRVG